MTTTKIWYQPDSATSNTFDVPGGTDDATKVVNLANFTRQENNRYRWQFTANGSAQANVSANNWPVIGNTALVAYTFSGGGTIPATQNQVYINGRWETGWNLITQNAVRKEYVFQHRNHIGGNLDETVDTITAPQLSPKNSFSPYQDYFITGAGVTGGSANTIQNVKFFSNTSVGATKISGSGEPSGTIDVEIKFVYTYNRRWEVNLHSTGSTISLFDSAIEKSITTTGTYFEQQTAVQGDYFATGYTTPDFYSSEDVAQYTLSGYIGDETETVIRPGVLAGLALGADANNTVETTATITATPTLGATASTAAESILATGTAVGVVQQATAQDNTIETAFAAGDLIGAVLPAAAAAEIESVWTDTEPSLLRGFNATFTEATDFEPQARNIIDITDGVGYIAADYAEPGYFNTGTGLTLFADSSLLEVDANIIRSDGTILFEGDFAATIQPGFQIDAGIITQGDAAFEISPYTTAGTGLLFAAAAELQEQANAAVQGGSLIIAAAEQYQAATLLSAQTTNIQDGISTIDLFSLTLASASESRPSILATIELLDGTGSLVVTAEVDTSSTAQLQLDTLQLQALAGYTLFGNTTNTIGINADFATEGRIYYIDEYYLSQVARETRLLSVRADAASLLVESETRVNTSLAENRGLVVEPETRTAKPELLPTTLKGARLRRIPV